MKAVSVTRRKHTILNVCLHSRTSRRSLDPDEP